MCTKVSVVIPVYNRAVLIRRTLDSVLAQTFEDFECIVSDNNSSDETLAVVREYADRDSRIKVLSQQTNLGPVRNWLAGAMAARGEFVKILFSDDWLEPECLALAVDAFNTYPSIGFVYFHAEVEGAGNFFLRNGGLETGRSFIWRSLVTHKDVPVSPTAGMFRKDDVINSLNRSIESLTGSDYLETGAGPDQAVYLHAADRYHDIYFINMTLVHYGFNKCSITVEASVKRPGHLLHNYFVAQLRFLKQSTKKRTLFGLVATTSVVVYLFKLVIRYRLMPKFFTA